MNQQLPSHDSSDSAASLFPREITQTPTLYGEVSLREVPDIPVEDAVVSNEVQTEAGKSTIIISIKNTKQRVKCAYVLVNEKKYIANENGCVVIPHTGEIIIEIWAENNAVRVVDGENAVLFPFISRWRIPRPSSWDCDIENQWQAFRMAVLCMDAYLKWRSGIGETGWPKMMTRLVFPDKSFKSSVCEPKSVVLFGVNKPFDEKPLIHIVNRSDYDWNRMLSAIMGEYGHSLHFSQLSVSQRHMLTWHYIGWFTGSGGSHSLETKTTEIVAYLEAWDFLFRFFTLPQENPWHHHFSRDNVKDTFEKLKNTIKPGEGKVWEVCILGLFHDVLADKGFRFLWERVTSKSKACSFQDFMHCWKLQEPSSFQWMMDRARDWHIAP